MSWLVAFAAVVLGASAPLSGARAGTDAILILDASGSMWGAVDGQSKIAAARQAVSAILAKWKPSDRLGLMAYGHRSKGDCKDIELVVPVAPLDAAKLKTTVGALSPKGKTPLSDALRQAAQALRTTENAATVILVSDGIETCGADPCAVAAELKKAGVGLTAHVVGFDIADPLAKSQLQCIARNTGGVYLDAKNAAGLETALTKVVDATQGKKVASEAPARPVAADPLKGKTLRAVAHMAEGLDPITDANLHWALHKPGEDGEKGDYVESAHGARLGLKAEPGDYVLEVSYGEVRRLFPVTIETGKPSELDLVLDAGFVTSEGTIGGSGGKAEDISWDVKTAGGDHVAHSGDTVPRFILPAGEYTMQMSKGYASITRSFTITPGDSINLAMTLEAGSLIVDGLYAAGGPKIEEGIIIEVRKPAKQEGTEGDVVANAYDALSRLDLPAGAYDLIVRVGEASKSQRIEVKAGAQTRITADLQAGVAGIAAPGAQAIEILSARKDINGNRKSIATAYGEEANLTLPAGDYLLRVTRGSETKEQALTVKAGERTEARIAP